jgi:hypothetical protein
LLAEKGAIYQRPRIVYDNLGAVKLSRMRTFSVLAKRLLSALVFGIFAFWFGLCLYIAKYLVDVTGFLMESAWIPGGIVLALVAASSLRPVRKAFTVAIAKWAAGSGWPLLTEMGVWWLLRVAYRYWSQEPVTDFVGMSALHRVYDRLSVPQRERMNLVLQEIENLGGSQASSAARDFLHEIASADAERPEEPPEKESTPPEIPAPAAPDSPPDAQEEELIALLRPHPAPTTMQVASEPSVPLAPKPLSTAAALGASESRAIPQSAPRQVQIQIPLPFSASPEPQPMLKLDRIPSPFPAPPPIPPLPPPAPAAPPAVPLRTVAPPPPEPEPAPAVSWTEKRASRRIYMKTRARIRRAGNRFEIVAPLDVSRDGICFTSPHRYALHETIRVALHYQDEEAPLETPASIVRVAQREQAWEYGVRFG